MAPMPQYRIFFIDQLGRFQDVEVIECVDDQHAIAAAQQRSNGDDVELWHRDRFITRIGGDGQVA